MPQRITVNPEQVQRITVNPAEVTRAGVESTSQVDPSALSAPQPFQSPVYPGGAATSSPFQVAQDQAAAIMSKLGLDKPILGAVDAASEIIDFFRRDSDIKADELKATAAARSGRDKSAIAPAIGPLGSGAKALKNDPLGAVKLGAEAAIATPKAIVGGIAGGARAATTSARGAASLVAPSIPSPTPEEFTSAAEGAADFATGIGAAAGLASGVGKAKQFLATARAVPVVEMDAALGQLSTTGIRAKGTSPYRIANESRQGMQQAFHEFGLDPAALPTKNRSPLVNELVIGGTEDDLARVNQVLEAEHEAAKMAGHLPEDFEFRPVESIQLAAADRMVDIYHRPIQNAVDTFAEVRRPEVKSRIASDLLKRANEEAAGNPALSAAYQNAARQVLETDDTVRALYALKTKANKMPSRHFSGTPSQQIAADVSTATAQVDMGNSIRKHLYPAIEQIGTLNDKPMKGELIKAGRREASAIQLRDGIYNEWSKAAFGQTSADLDSWWSHTIRGHSESVPVLGTPFLRPSVFNAAGRALKGVDKPMANFNSLLSKGTGTLKGFTPESAVVQSDLWNAAQASDIAAPTPGLKVGTPSKGQMNMFERDPNVGGGAMAPPSLFSIHAPSRWRMAPPAQRDIFTLKDLQEMRTEIEQYLRSSGVSGSERAQWVSDLDSLDVEINRRTQARRTR